MLNIKIETSGSAYSDNGDNISINGRYALSENLKKIAESIEMNISGGAIMDVNGNNVGRWTLE